MGDDGAAGKKAKKEKAVKEARVNKHGATVRYRSKPTIKDQDRIDRAMARGMGAPTCDMPKPVSYTHLTLPTKA